MTQAKTRSTRSTRSPVANTDSLTALASAPTTPTTLTISSHNYSSWSMRGWLLVKLAGLEFETVAVPVDDPAARAELLLLSPSILVPCLLHDGIKVWDTLAIAEYLNEIRPDAKLLPADRKARAHCRAICGEMHSGFSALRSALPMNLRAHFDHFRIWSRAQDDIERIVAIWRECFDAYGGPWLFGDISAADAMYAPVVTRFLTYDVKLDRDIAEYCTRVLKQPFVAEWIAMAQAETEDIDELDVEF
ncbi:glutathione S-transferase family protein [Paraburkholderia phosphatilytica]|uniref:glutathione S-transferase family protein n=1 Tax=Paraburkholderia phosphatilytica TaxID=2282883 RepID=UPI000E470A92|nr:glutathione S-transferase family protein [Paraburkholderia phosphatilytica]